ncbi:hypothetical protein [Bacillus sp. JCM 19034]|uniref:DUF6115 domain-containing protein n=1 Tax=Bacillus sp. JCM 19034 TaxID=1481928 RepID=UPI0007838B31|nr:hypothetical protein [Bacillus sp. JCM 19034]
MFELLLVVSLLMHGFVIFWIIILIQRIRNTENRVDEMNQLKSEIEDVLVAYTTEMKEENERLIQRLRKNNEQTVTKLQQKTPHTPPIKQQSVNEIVEQSLEYKPPIELPEQETYEKSYHAKVLELFDLGHSYEEIAKTLDMGKGEVELILKFRQ